MKKIPDDVKITWINIPGTHDSTACFVDFAFISKTQSLTVAEQLSAGVRYFDFRFKYVDGRFIANHSIAYCRKKQGFWNSVLTADDIVNDCISFVKNNPSETVLFQLKEAVSHAEHKFFDSFFERYIKDNMDFWYLKNSVPTLGEARGKIVLLRVTDVNKENFNDSNSGINFSGYPYVGSVKTDDWRKCEIRSLENKKTYTKMFVQDSYKVEGQKKWGTVSRFLDSSLNKDEFNICLTSCTRFFVPKYNSVVINKKLKKYNFLSGKTYGIIVMDYVNAELCEKIIATNIFEKT